MSLKITKNRRAFLASSKVLLALPLFDSLLEANSSGSDIKRLVFMGAGYGFTKETFYPTKAGRFEKHGLTSGLSPLEKHKKDISFVSNLTNLGATDAHGGSTSYLTGANVAGTPGKRFHNSISLDQVAAKYIGQDTRYSSLSLAAKSNKDGHGAGLSLSWNDKGQPIAGINSAVSLYDTLFGQGTETHEELINRLKHERSILDGVYMDAKGLKPYLSKLDQTKLNDYFDTIRQIELSLKKQVEWSKIPKPKTHVKRPNDEMDALQEMKTMHSLIVAGLQTDSTRIFTYRQPVESIMQSAGFNLTAHSLSHYNLSPGRGEASQKKDQLFMGLFASFLDKMKETKDLNGKSLFDTTMISYGTNLRSGHSLKNLPAIFTGRGAKGLKYGEHIALPNEDTPLANYWLTLMQQTGLPMKEFSHSTGVLEEMYS